MNKMNFPNGLTNYLETYFEVVSYITLSLDIDTTIQSVTIFHEVQETQGRVGLYTLAKRWTNDFEKLYYGRVWDGEWFDVLYKFLENKVNEHEQTG